jgi:PIN domain nuclease of toxin-antitoxin system
MILYLANSGKEVMKLLLDTHAFLWMNSDPNNLSEKARIAIVDSTNMLLLSMISVWEMQIKVGIGKLQLEVPLPAMIQENQELNKLIIMPITLEHVFALDNLPAHHKDPFDRLLIAQAKVEDATLVTADPLIHQYDVSVLW